MRRMIYLLPVLCILGPVNATNAASPAPDINCKSARLPSVPLKTYFETCDAQAAAARSRSGQLALSSTTVFQDRTTVAGRTFTGVPTWTDADILSQFPLTRDNRYMTVSSNPGFQRRISWMYPADGCFSRAEQVDVQAANAGKVRPYKLFAFGALHVTTSNDPKGYVDWGWHTVPVVKNSAGEPIVFDAA